MNVELLRKIQAHNTEHPEQLDMGHGLSKDGCRTTGCIAGLACLLVGESYAKTDCPSWYILQSKAAKILGLGHGQSNRLFFEEEWPEELMTAVANSSPGTPEYAAAVNAGIDHYIETGGAE